MPKSTLFVKKLVLIALLGASLNAVKFCLMYIPNVEAVTLLIVVYTYAFGLSVGFPATLVFCVLEGFLWGFNPTWLVSYFIHWPFISLVTYLCKLLKLKNPLLLALIIGAATALFGLQSTFVYSLTGGAVGKPGWTERFWLTYASGAGFYIAQVATNLILISCAFLPASRLLNKLGQRYFGNSSHSVDFRQTNPIDTDKDIVAKNHDTTS